MRFDYESLAVLSSVIRTGSFEAAAVELNVTQSAVSQRIKQLEERTGALLIIRGRPSRPTDEAMLLTQHLEYVALLEDELSERLASESNEERGNTISVRICVNNDSLATWFPKVLGRLAEETRIRLEIITDDQEFSEERLLSGDTLATVSSSDKPLAGCQTIPLGEMRYIAVATPEFYERYFAEGVDVAAISQSPFITFDRKDRLPTQWILLSQDYVPALNTHFVPSFEAHLLTGISSGAWVLMPTIAVAKHLENKSLVEILPGATVSVPLFWKVRHQTSKTLAVITSVVQEVAKENLIVDYND